jgi:hypothetical protein
VENICRHRAQIALKLFQAALPAPRQLEACSIAAAHDRMTAWPHDRAATAPGLGKI